jgi:hypothetical protein
LFISHQSFFEKKMTTFDKSKGRQKREIIRLCRRKDCRDWN